ncbi:heparan-alpha-glucosaminide N-acetyltransferase domain-containing protein [Corynebacterium flavescens]
MLKKERVAGVDIARAVAIIGMVAAHFIPPDPQGLGFVLVDEITDGLPAALFAVLAGVSLSFMGTRGARSGGQAWQVFKFQQLVRGLVLMAAGTLLTGLQDAINVVLISIGAVIIILCPAVRLRTTRIAQVAGAVFLLGPLIPALLPGLNERISLFGGAFPLWSWVGYGCVGIIAHRMLLDSGRSQAIAAAVGLVLTTGGLFLRGVLDIFLSGGYGTTGRLFLLLDSLPEFFISGLSAYLAADGHSGGLIDQATSVGFSLLVLSLCLMLGAVRGLSFVLTPFKAFGSMALTLYVAHVLSAAWVYGAFVPFDPSETAAQSSASVSASPSASAQNEGSLSALGWSLVVGLAGATAWKARYRRGPLEAAMHRIVVAQSSLSVPPTGASVPESAEEQVQVSA